MDGSAAGRSLSTWETAGPGGAPTPGQGDTDEPLCGQGPCVIHTRNRRPVPGGTGPRAGEPGAPGDAAPARRGEAGPPDPAGAAPSSPQVESEVTLNPSCPPPNPPVPSAGLAFGEPRSVPSVWGPRLARWASGRCAACGLGTRDTQVLGRQLQDQPPQVPTPAPTSTRPHGPPALRGPAAPRSGADRSPRSTVLGPGRTRTRQ